MPRWILLILSLLSVAIRAQDDDNDQFDPSEAGDEEFDPYDEDAMDLMGGGSPTPITQLETEEDLRMFLEPATEESALGGGVVGVFSGASKELKEAFETFGGKLNGKGYRFAVATSQALLSKYAVKDFSWKVMVHPPPKYVHEPSGDKPKHRFGGSDLLSDDGKASLKAFIVDRTLLSVNLILPAEQNERVLVEKGLPVFVVITKIDEERDPKGMTYIMNRVRKIRDKFKEKLVFALVDLESAGMTQNFQKYLFVGEEEFKGERIVGIKDGPTYYSMKDTFSPDVATAFIQNFLDGKLTPSHVMEDEMPFDGEEDADPYGLMGGDPYDAMDEGESYDDTNTEL